MIKHKPNNNFTIWATLKRTFSQPQSKMLPLKLLFVGFKAPSPYDLVWTL